MPPPRQASPRADELPLGAPFDPQQHRAFHDQAAILKVFGMVNVAPGFVDGAGGVHLAAVLDGCTNQLAEIFGDEAGIPARVAVGMAELPLGAAVETEMTVALHD